MRIYDGKYISVTSIVALREPFDKKSFEDWCKAVGKDPVLISSTSRILGEKVSDYLDNICKDSRYLTAPCIDDLEERLYSAVDNFVDEWILLDTEQKIVCKELNYAGRYDGKIQSKVTGEILLVDWKTFGAWKEGKYKRDSNKIKHTRWQLSMYANAMNWKNNLGVVIFKADGSWELEKVQYDEEMIQWVVENQELILKAIENGKSKQ